MKSGHSLTKLAAKLNIDKAHLSRMETGKKPINLETIYQIASIYDLEPAYFLGGLTEGEYELMTELDLTDEELMDKYNLIVDGKKVSKKEIKTMLTIIRGLREGE